MKTLNILLIEDNDGDIFLARQMLKHAAINHTISILNDGETAIDFFNNLEERSGTKFPDIILLDINLPKKNGFEVLSVIRSSDKTRHLPVIILTTSSDITDREFAEHYKADRYIPKPLCAEDFKKAVVALIPE